MVAANAIGRENVAAVRRALRALGLVVAEIDRDLRYVWIDNPHPDFDPGAIVGRRDDELMPAEEAADIMAAKREVLATGAAMTGVFTFNRSDGERRYNLSAAPILDSRGHVTGLITAAVPL